MLHENVKPFGVSLALHGALVGALAVLAARKVMEERPPDFVDFEIVTPVRERPEPEQPTPPPEEEEPPIPAAKRPERVPEKAKVRKVEKVRPFQPDSLPDTGAREAPEDTEAVPAPSAPLPVLEMESTIGTGGTGGYVTTSETGGTVPVRAGPGGGRGGAPARGRYGPLANQGARGVKVSPDWEITRMPEPLNDRDFEPRYPALAKREGREAVVVLRLYIDAEGNVSEVQVVEGTGAHGFEKAAIAYARKLRFRPARAGARKVAARIDWSVHFYVRN